MHKFVLSAIAVAATLILNAGAWAQQGPPQYRSPGVTLEQAKKAVEAAEAEAKKNGWLMAIAVMSNGGHLIHFSRMDQTQIASIKIAQHKARTAATFRRPTKAFQAVSPPIRRTSI